MLEFIFFGGITLNSLERNYNKDELSCELYMLISVIFTYAILYYESWKPRKKELLKIWDFWRFSLIKMNFFSNTTSSRMFTNHMSSNDRNWPVDLFMCRSQITKGMLCNWLHKVIKRVASSWWFLRVVPNLNHRSKVDNFLNGDQFFFFVEKLRRDIDLILFAS